MSHIQAKIARRAVRQIGKHPREVQLASQPYFVPPFPAGVGRGYMFHPRDLVQSCGRAVYRALKKATRKGLVPAI